MLSLGALAAWGLWGLFATLASRRLPATSALVWEVVGAVLVAIVILPVALRSNGTSDSVGVVHAVLTGVAYTVGLVLLFAALAATGRPGGHGSVHAVLMITALYPLVASLLAVVFLQAPLTPRQLLAIPLALGAVVLLATEGT